MKIELRDIHYRGNFLFDGQLYVNGKHTCTVTDDAGGGFEYTHFSPSGEDIKELAEAFCRHLPPMSSAGMLQDGADLKLEMNLELYLINLLKVHLQSRLEQKLESAGHDCIVYGQEGGALTMLPLGEEISGLSVKPAGRLLLQRIISQNILPDMKPGDIIFNTNIPEEILKNTGLSPDQYRSDLRKAEPGKTPKQKSRPGKKL